MALQIIDGHLLREMILSGASVLEKNKANVDALNVFPVPDGDTGTNMSMTMMAAAREINGMDTGSAGAVAEAAARGALKGARGNSGVILSQLFRGFSRCIDGAVDIDAKKLAEALKEGSDTAYKAVMKPKEGTILSVARTIAETTVLATAEEDLAIYSALDVMLESGEKALRKTPDQLPVLKQAGVVDAGAKGLLLIYAGYKMALDGEEVDVSIFDFGASAPIGVEFIQEEEDITFAYCTELFIKDFKEGITEQDVEHLREKLGRIGDCVLVVGDMTLTKVHVHSNAPGKVLQMGLALGVISNIKIDNMREQHRSLADGADALHAVENRKDVGFVAVSSGEGLSAVFRDLAVNAIVEGGQTMNPSIEDLSNAIAEVRAKTVFVLPNNSNIILAAQQAANLADCRVVVLPTKSVPMGIAAMVAYVPDASVEDNEAAMTEAAKLVHTGQVTYAVRHTTWNDQEIQQGDILGLCDGKIACVGSDVQGVCLELLEHMVGEDSELITLFYGQDTPAEQAESLLETLNERYDACDIEMLSGGQPLYYYLFSVE